MKQYDIKHQVQGCKPVRAVVFLFFILFLLSNCQIKKSLSDALLDHSRQANTTQRIDKGLPAATKVTQHEACGVLNNSAYADQDLHATSDTATLPVVEFFILTYLPFLLIFTRFSGDVHSPLAHLFKVLPADSGSPIYIKNRYLLI
ncbi:MULTISPECIES: hypothetical protein [Dyadobacter]|uniref:Uncharacterized protein n=1 Tax=Dyadobacter sediminis TaxID=1493691 RepID=A0A5R9K6D9_9BACT|nr:MULTISPECIES: hypothetical protein [Dyadobacter]TLU89351.1 hypothetical protein FEM55_21630 [Dyadobacter sediminis]